MGKLYHLTFNSDTVIINVKAYEITKVTKQRFYTSWGHYDKAFENRISKSRHNDLHDVFTTDESKVEELKRGLVQAMINNHKSHIRMYEGFVESGKKQIEILDSLYKED